MGPITKKRGTYPVEKGRGGKATEERTMAFILVFRVPAEPGTQ